MQAQGIDAAEFRSAQRDSWNIAATGWAKWSPRIDEWTGAVSRRLVELAAVQPGNRVLDIACGYGEPALTAARAATPGGSVVATDIAPEMIAFGRERAQREGIDNIEFVESAAGALDLEPQSFDAAVSRWGLIFEPEGEATAGRIRGFMKPGARIAIASWGPPERVPMVSLAMQTAMRKLDVPPPPPGTPGPLSRPTPEAIASLLQGGGFGDVQVEEMQVMFEWESADEFTNYTRDIVAPLVAMVRQHPDDVQRDTWETITQAARDFAGGDGPVRMDNLVLLASGSA